MDDIYEWASGIVFSAQIVADAVKELYFVCTARDTMILPQGHCAIPGVEKSMPDENHRRRIRALVRPSGHESSFVVVGMGAVDIRKGVEVFLAAANQIWRIAPELDVHFCWVGQGYDPARDNYSGFLAEHVQRSGLGGVIDFVGAVDDTDPVYDAADVPFLSSRLDPLPNVALDAAVAGVPVVCFDGASGMPEILEPDETLRELVVPYADGWAAALVIVRMAQDSDWYGNLSSRIRALAAATFDMTAYADKITAFAQRHTSRLATVREDTEILLKTADFDETFYSPPGRPFGSREDAVRHYLVQSAVMKAQPPWYLTNALRRPMPGFHPIVYAESHPDRDGETPRDPLVKYLQAGKPDGPWKHDVIRVDDLVAEPAGKPLRVAVHGHFHYPELLSQFLHRLLANDMLCDLFISVTSREGARQAATLLSNYRRGSVEIVHVPNTGRNSRAANNGYRGSVG